MKVKHIMTSDVVVASPGDSICVAAQRMAECDAGALPVGDGERLVGVITDRDIAIRAVALRLSPDTPVREVMSQEVLYCFDEEEVEDVARNMADQQIRRLPVVNRDKRLVGIVSLADLAVHGKSKVAADAVAGISRPGGRHDQTLH